MTTTLETALSLHSLDYPIVIVPAGEKAPCETAWQEKRFSKEEIERRWSNNPNLNVGLLLGLESGIIDIEGDGDGWEEGIAKLFDGAEIPVTPSFRSQRGRHWLFAYDSRLDAIGTATIKCQAPYTNVELRIGGSAAAQSLMPPSTTHGFTREWITPLASDCRPAQLPDAVIERILAAGKPAVAPAASDDFDEFDAARHARNVEAVEAYLSECRATFNLRSDGERTFFDLASCPFKGQLDGNAAICVEPDGSIWAKCHHGKCDGKKWADFQEAFGRPFDSTDDKPITDIAGRDDRANAQRFVARHGEKIRWCDPWKRWLVWDGRRWAIDETRAIETLAKEYANSLWRPLRRLVGKLDDKAVREITSFVRTSNGANGIKNMLALARSEPGVAIMPDQLDHDPMLLTVLNGTINLRTGKIRASCKADSLTKLAPVEFHSNAACPTWLNFLSDIFAGNPGLIAFVQRWLGYCLTGSVREQKLVIGHGGGANGKTTLIEIFMRILGDFALKAPPRILMTRHGEQHPTERACLFGKRAVFVNETDADGRLDEATVKDLTGGDKQTARRVYQDFWSFEATHKITLATNHRPAVRGVDHAIWRRIILLPFDVTIPESKQDRELGAKLLAEAPGILRWCVEGCLEWHRVGLSPPAEAINATADYRQSEDALGTFLSDCCVLGDDQSVGATKLLAAYREWGDGGQSSVRQLAALLRGRGFRSDRFTAGPERGRVRWNGLTLKSAE